MVGELAKPSCPAIEQVLASHGYRVATAGDREHAEQLKRQEAADVIFIQPSGRQRARARRSLHQPNPPSRSTLSPSANRLDQAPATDQASSTQAPAAAGSSPNQLYPGRDESPTTADSSSTRLNTARVLRMAEVERRAIVDALRACGGCVARAARALGISEATIYRKMRTYGIQRRSLID